VGVLTGLDRHNIVTELVAGITLLAIAVPLNIGYAQIAGLPPTAGLYALIVPGILYALVASSRQVVASPDAAAAALVASSIGGLAAAGSAGYLAMAFAQAILCGLFFVAFSALKLGFLANFLSKPILVGFVGGLALDILVSQVAKMLGVSIDSGAEFVDKLAQLITGLPTTNLFALLISAGSVAILLGGRRLARAVPWALVVLVLTTLVDVWADLERLGVKVLGSIEAGPPTLSWPDLPLSVWIALIPSALALTLVTTAEGLLVARSYGEKRRYETSPNRDLMAFGVGNVAAGLTGGFTIGSSTSRTAAMDQAGSRTQLPSIVTAVGTLLLVLFGTALLEHIPNPAIGAVVAVAVVPLLGIAEFRRLWSQDRGEFAVGAVCFLGAVFLGPITGIAVAFILSLILLASRAASPPVDVLSRAGIESGALTPVTATQPTTAPGLVIVRFAAPIFFANSTELGDRARQAVRAGGSGDTAVQHLVLDLEAVTDIDVTGAENLQSLIDWLHDHQVALGYSRVRPEILARLNHLDLVQDATIYPTNRAAIEALENPPG
jgi:high affinity sulfate transporter 1